MQHERSTSSKNWFHATWKTTKVLVGDGICENYLTYSVYLCFVVFMISKVCWMVFVPVFMIYNFVESASAAHVNIVQLLLSVVFLAFFALAVLFGLVIIPIQTKYTKYICAHCDTLSHFHRNNGQYYKKYCIDYIKYYLYPWVAETPQRREIVFEIFGKEIGSIIAQFAGDFAINVDIETFLRLQQEMSVDDQRHSIGLILLGAPGAGKTTVMKQIKYSTEGDFTLQEKNCFRKQIYCQIVASLSRLIEYYCDSNKYFALQRDTEQLLSSLVTKFNDDLNDIDTDLNVMDEIGQLWKVWNDSEIRMIYDNARNEMNALSYSDEHFFGCMGRICHNDYIPTPQDIFLIDRHTTEVTQNVIVHQNNWFRIIDGIDSVLSSM